MGLLDYYLEKKEYLSFLLKNINLLMTNKRQIKMAHL